jgi:hypothetical protein
MDRAKSMRYFIRSVGIVSDVYHNQGVQVPAEKRWEIRASHFPMRDICFCVVVEKSCL